MVDYLWYRRKVKGAYVDSLGFDVIDEWGRMMPDPGRWPSSQDGKGFTKVAEEVHKIGLKFGIHVMGGISTQAFNANTPILDVNTVTFSLSESLLKDFTFSASTKVFHSYKVKISGLVKCMVRAKHTKSLVDSGMQKT